MPTDNAKRPRGRPKKQESAGLEAKILDTAILLFAENGFETVTIKMIAQSCSVAPSLVHHHFGSRDGLRTACRNYVIEAIRQTLAEYDALVPEDASMDLLELFGQVLRTGLGDRTHLLRFLAMTFSENHAVSRELFAEYFGLFHKITSRYVAAGKLRSDIDPKWMTMHAIYMQLGTAFLYEQTHHQLGGDPYAPEISKARTDAFVKIAQHGLMTDRLERAAD